MFEKANIKRRFGKKTTLTLNVAYTCSILAFIFSLFCYFYLDIKGVIFQSLLIYSIANIINVLLFFKHKNMNVMYNIMSVLAFAVAYMLCLFSGGISSPFVVFLVLLIFSGYTASVFYGNLWFVIISLSAISLYVLSLTNNEFINNVTIESSPAFHFFFFIFLILLLGGVFGRLMNRINRNLYLAKNKITESNEEKAVMLKEIHHRVKNNLQVVNSLLRMQARGIKDEKIKMMFKLAQSRIVTMARLHEKLYHTESLKNINVSEHFQVLINDLICSYNLDNEIDSRLNIEPVQLSLDTLLPLSLIINEMVSNSLKHAFNNVAKGEVVVELKSTDHSQYELIVGDNGECVNNNTLPDFANSSGVILIKSFVKQLNGSIHNIESKEGSFFKVVFDAV